MGYESPSVVALVVSGTINSFIIPFLTGHDVCLPLILLCFICFYCAEKFEVFEEIIKHLNHRHQKQDIKYKQLELDSSTGLLGYRTKSLEGVQPSTHTVSACDDNLVVNKRSLADKTRNIISNIQDFKTSSTFLCYYCNLRSDDYKCILEHVNKLNLVLFRCFICLLRAKK